MTIQKNSEILVKVDEALEDLLVVSYFTDDKKYQGVLLDTTKNKLPYGIYGLNPAFTPENSSDEDKLHTVSQRYAYQESHCAAGSSAVSGRHTKAKLPTKQKMTVRLRPRKVLCSNCQAICNENSENVHLKKRKAPCSDSNESAHTEKKLLMGSMLIPKISRLQPNEITSALKGKKPKTDDSNKNTLHKASYIPENNDVIHDVAFVNINDTSDEKFDIEDKNVGVNFFKSAKTLKICFGEGEGTVVKIPPLGDQNEDSGVCDMTREIKDLESKAARRAKKKAKKLSKKKAESLTSSNNNQKHIGALSPRNNLCDSTCNTNEKKSMQKVKHKKKQRASDKTDENARKPEKEIGYFIDIKNQANNNSSNDNDVALNCGIDIHPEEWEGDAAPDFPMNGTEGAVETALHVSPGDIVWGKVVGFPWWPGRVLSVTSTAKAHVAWYACTTSSLMPCDSLSPFLEDFKLRFNKRKRGTYKEAVRLATQEAKLFESQLQDPLGSPAPSISNLSPREVNVIS